MNISKKTLSNPVLVIIVFALLGIMGLFTFKKVEVNLYPEMNEPYLMVFANYENAEMEKLIEEMSINEEIYDDKIGTFLKFYQNEVPYIGLYFKTSTLLTNKSVKGNFNPSWNNYFRNITLFSK